MKVFRSAVLLLFFSSLAAFSQTPANEPPRPLTARGLENLVAFTRLLGYVRHFHPGDQAAAPPAPARPEGFVPSGNDRDRATRLAAVALGWNVPQHFYPYFDVVKTDWPAVLRRSLQAAATDADERAFLDTLRRMVAALHDGHASVWHKFDSWSGRLPLFWDWIEGQVVVTHAAPEAGAVRRGDVVLRLNGQPMAEALAAREELVSGASPEWKHPAALFTLALGAPAGENRRAEAGHLLPRPHPHRRRRLQGRPRPPDHGERDRVRHERASRRPLDRRACSPDGPAAFLDEVVYADSYPP